MTDPVLGGETRDRLEAIRKRAEEATPGPWLWARCYELLDEDGDLARHWALKNRPNAGTVVDPYLITYTAEALGLGGENIGQSPNFTFIAHAREDIPWLLGEVSRLREAMAAFVAKYDQCAPHIDSAFAFKQFHGMPYSGPSYNDELQTLRELSRVPSVEGSPTVLGGSEPDAP